MRRFILDASVALAWFLDNPVPAHAIQARRAILTGDRALVPGLWHLEMANGLVVAERRRILAAADLTRALANLEQLLQAIETQGATVPVRLAVNTARSFHLSAYDAVYLELAREQALPLATLDDALQAAALKAGVDLLR